MRARLVESVTRHESMMVGGVPAIAVEPMWWTPPWTTGEHLIQTHFASKRRGHRCTDKDICYLPSAE